jgi:O-acetyl-ADP-ribose deacetylase (regulator of RNase III)
MLQKVAPEDEMKIVIGDLIKMALDGQIDVVVQGCNCYCRMKRGIAKTIAETFPEAVAADNATSLGDKNKLGSCSMAMHIHQSHIIHIVNAYTQYHWEGDSKEILVDYDAIRSCMEIVKRYYPRSRIGIPLIGAGLARGDWSVIERIILEELGDLDVTIVHFQA